MGLREKWIGVFYKAATSSIQIRTPLTLVGGLLFATLVGIFVALPLWLDRLLGFPRIFSTSFSIAVSVPILALGLSLMLWSILHFIKVRGTPVPFSPPSKLVTTGPYAHARNPMLTGLFIFLLGLGILFGSISLIFIFTPLFVLLSVLELRAIEEPELEKRLGTEYIEYKKRTPMFIPRLKGGDDV
ncbi:MAG: isoprenylcysteine carboxylmethyltransferase family protein [Gammaproteobacteria bacterium]|nr:isoprenylcysteine carboxylmethyltransferase family protein [Gammaproteobacteria bacterium]